MHFANSLQLPMPRLKLLEKLKENRTKHVEEYEAAVTGYRLLCRQELTERLAHLTSGLCDDKALEKIFYFTHSAPVSMEEAYDEVISMLEFTEEQTITIDGGQYRAWVEDKWDWSSNVLSNSVYASGCLLK